MGTADSGAELGAEFSDAVVLFHEAIGGLLGISAADHKALGLLRREGPMSAGELAEWTALSAGAVTGLIDRLEAARLARRERDTGDRRRLVVAATESSNPAVAAAFADLGVAMGGVSAQFTPDQLAVIAEWVRRTTEVLRAQAAAVAARHGS